MKKIYATIIVIMFLKIRQIICHNGSTPQEEFARLVHPSQYDKSMQPMIGTGRPVKVTVDVLVNTIFAIDEVEMSMEVDVFLRQTWFDPRIQIPYHNRTLALGYGSLDSIWVPDLFFPDSSHAKRHDISTPNVLLRLKEDGRILYSQRLLLSLSCFMKLETFPLDSQNCPIKVESYGYTTEDLIFVWDEKKPIDFVSDKVPQYEMTDKKLDDCTTEYTTGSYSCLVAYLHVKRDRGYYITQTFVPSILIVILSWASFWIDKEATPARVSVGLLTVLSITTQSASIFAKRLKVSYIKAVDVWMATCLIFVFSAYMEYALVNVLARKYYKTSNKNERMKSLKEALFSIHDYMTADEERIAKANGRKTDRTLIKQRMMEAVEENGALPGTKNKKKEGGTDIKRANLGSIVDKCARFFFPCGFVLFNIIFWTYYTMNWSS